MQIHFTYADTPPFEVPDSNLLGVMEPRQVPEPPPLAGLVEAALDAPIGAERVEQLVTPATRILILVDDITRQTPAAGILPGLLRRLAGRGCPSQNIKLLIAAGTHSHMTQAEIEHKIGPAVLRDYSLTVHHWKELGNLTEIGATADGTPIRINRMLREADFVMGIGMIVPHRVMGFTGGSTIVQPGVSGPDVTGYTHWASAKYSGKEILGLAENPVRREVEQIARQAGLRYIVNVVMDGQARVNYVVAGDPIAAHRKGAQDSLGIWGAAQPQFADIVISESYPADYDLWQAAKGIYSAELSMREGGVAILVTPCPHGVSEEHPEVEVLGYRGFEEVKALVERKEITDLVGAAHLVHVGRVIRDLGRGIMVCPGIKPDVQRHIGFEPAATPQAALNRAFELMGKTAQVAVLKHGGNVMPIVRA